MNTAPKVFRSIKPSPGNELDGAMIVVEQAALYEISFAFLINSAMTQHAVSSSISSEGLKENLIGVSPLTTTKSINIQGSLVAPQPVPMALIHVNGGLAACAYAADQKAPTSNCITSIQKTCVLRLAAKSRI